MLLSGVNLPISHAALSSRYPSVQAARLLACQEPSGLALITLSDPIILSSSSAHFPSFANTHHGSSFVLLLALFSLPSSSSQPSPSQSFPRSLTILSFSTSQPSAYFPLSFTVCSSYNCDSPRVLLLLPRLRSLLPSSAIYELYRDATTSTSCGLLFR